MTSHIDITVASPAWAQTPDARQTVERAIAACESFFPPQDGDDELSVLLCDDAEIRRLNLQWRGKDLATNVLSFPTPEGPAGFRHLGDIAIAYETVAVEAARDGKSLSDHLSHLTVHGYLHLIGFDHENDADAEEMEALERDILTRLGVADPYAAAPEAGPLKS